MELITLTFERVFDLHRYPEGRNQKKHTLFSFSTSTGTQYGVSVPGWPKIEPGDTVTAILTDSSNWQTLCGWANHQTKEIAVHSATRLLLWSALSIFSAWLFYLAAFGSGGGTTPGLEKVIIAFICLFLCVGSLGIIRYVQQMKVTKLLKKALKNATAG